MGKTTPSNSMNMYYLLIGVSGTLSAPSPTITFCISGGVLRAMLYSCTRERTWQFALTAVLWTLCQRPFSSRWNILPSSVLTTSARRRSVCRLFLATWSPAPTPEATINSPCCESSSTPMGLAWRTHIHSTSVMWRRSSIQRWTESTWRDCIRVLWEN